MGLLLVAIILCLSSIVIARASNGFEAAADYLGRNLQDGVKGATINAMGSSMPELFTTLIFLVVLQDADGFASGIGTTAGSALFNGMIIPALVAFTVYVFKLSQTIYVSKKVILRDGLALIFCEAVLIVFLGSEELSYKHALILNLLYVGYIIMMLRTMTRRNALGEADDKENEPIIASGTDPIGVVERKKWWKWVSFMWLDLEKWIIGVNAMNNRNAVLLLVASTLLMGFGCHWLVESCIWLGSDVFAVLGMEFNGLGIPVYFLSIILASAATSVPDTLLSIKDARKGNYNDAVSNALGSNIFDICFALGFPLLLYTLANGPIHLSQEIIHEVSELRMLLLILTVFAFFIFLIGRNFSSGKGWMLLGLYVLFSVYIFGRALDWEMMEPLAEWLQRISARLAVVNL